MVQNGIYNRDEIRNLEDDNHIPGGELYTVQMQMVELQKAVENINSQSGERLAKAFDSDFVTIDQVNEAIQLSLKKQLNGHYKE